KPLEYVYDFSKSWEHIITITGRAKPTAKIRCLSGEGHGVAEDVMGPKGWKDLKQAYQTNNPNEEQKSEREWYETLCWNGSAEGLADDVVRGFDKAAVDRQLV
ncbi:hypothetical protein M011DRAFT_392003, partial [Sporormia fimetaria CBS 119925]